MVNCFISAVNGCLDYVYAGKLQLTDTLKVAMKPQPESVWSEYLRFCPRTGSWSGNEGICG